MPVELLPVEMAKGANVGFMTWMRSEVRSPSSLRRRVRDAEVVDADVRVLLLGADGRVRSNDDMIFTTSAWHSMARSVCATRCERVSTVPKPCSIR